MKKEHKKYSKPKQPFNKERLIEEEEIKKEFGLKNKKEIWRSESKIKLIRKKAKKLISSSPEEQQVLFNNLKKMGFDVNSIADVLFLDKTDYLKRRLQSIIKAKRMTTTIKKARQLIVHKKVIVDGGIVNSPSYIVPVSLEEKISLKVSKDPKVKVQANVIKNEPS